MFSKLIYPGIDRRYLQTNIPFGKFLEKSKRSLESHRCVTHGISGTFI